MSDSRVPMVMVDDRRRYVEVNRPARLWFRLSLEEMRTVRDRRAHAMRRGIGIMEQVWARLLDVGCVAGRYPVRGCRMAAAVDVVYCGSRTSCRDCT